MTATASGMIRRGFIGCLLAAPLPAFVPALARRSPGVWKEYGHGKDIVTWMLWRGKRAVGSIVWVGWKTPHTWTAEYDQSEVRAFPSLGAAQRWIERNAGW